MNKDQDQMLRESHLAAKRVEEFLFGTDAENDSAKTSRAQALDAMIFGLKAGKLGYRIILGAAVFAVAVGSAWAALKGWRL